MFKITFRCYDYADSDYSAVLSAIYSESNLRLLHSDTAALEAFVDQAIAANPGPVADFKAGKKAAAGFFVGQVMKLSKGKADPKLVGPLVAKKLAAL